MKNQCLLFLLAFICCCTGGFAQVFTPIDIFAGANSSSPGNFMDLNGKMIFSAIGDSSTGSELWISDGTTSGTTLLKDIYPGPASSAILNMAAANGKVYFSANDGTHGIELWVTDGTTTGTQIVSDINPSGGSSPKCMTAFNGKVYFSATDGTHGVELWVTDGTAGGTALVKDINPGSSDSDPFGVTLTNGLIYDIFTVFNNKLYFSANDGVHGTELWSTDGTTTGTTMVADCWAGPSSGNADIITVLGSNLIFTANDSLHGNELWISDGTGSGTSILKDINPGMSGAQVGYNSGFTAFNNKLYFQAATDATGIEMWSTDGTTSGTAIVIDILPGPGSSEAGYYGFFPFNGKLYFGASDSVHGLQLWSSDGTGAGTSLLKVLSSYTPYTSYPVGYVNYHNQLIFDASTDTINERQLWISDGTTAGTHILAPAIAPNANPLGGGPFMRIAGDNLFMSANFNSIGQELWVYNSPNTAINEVSSAEGISAYPNPFDRSVTLTGLQSREVYTVQVIDMTGRLCYSSEMSHPASTASVTIPDLNTGVYMIRLNGANGISTFRMTKN